MKIVPLLFPTLFGKRGLSRDCNTLSPLSHSIKCCLPCFALLTYLSSAYLKPVKSVPCHYSISPQICCLVAILCSTDIVTLYILHLMPLKCSCHFSESSIIISTNLAQRYCVILFGPLWFVGLHGTPIIIVDHHERSFSSHPILPYLIKTFSTLQFF